MKENLATIKQERDWINQSDLARITGIDVRTIRAMRKRGDLDASARLANDIWISVKSIQRYCRGGAK